MKSFILTMTTLFMLVVSACATQQGRTSPGKNETSAWAESIRLGKGDFGDYPTRYKDIVTDYFSDVLKDPESARYDFFREPKKDVHIIDIDNESALYGYSVCVYVNAKNSYGGYTGKKPYWVLIRNDSVIHSVSPEAYGFDMDRFAEEFIMITCAHPKVSG